MLCVPTHSLEQALVAKLDALSHFHFAPKPVVEELTVRSDVAAVLMEEAAPVVVSAAPVVVSGGGRPGSGERWDISCDDSEGWGMWLAE